MADAEITFDLSAAKVSEGIKRRKIQSQVFMMPFP
jgi:hypothetical protein